MREGTYRSEFNRLQGMSVAKLAVYLSKRMQGKLGPPIQAGRGEYPHDFIRWAYSVSGSKVRQKFAKAVARAIGRELIRPADERVLFLLLRLVEELGLDICAKEVLAVISRINAKSSLSEDVHTQALASALVLGLYKRASVQARLAADIHNEHYVCLAFEGFRKISENAAVAHFPELVKTLANATYGHAESDLRSVLLLTVDTFGQEILEILIKTTNSMEERYRNFVRRACSNTDESEDEFQTAYRKATSKRL